MPSNSHPPAWLKTFRPEQVRDLDPRRHTLIEASAGTGKTFAIEHLVLRLLIENPKWNPEEILLLSFTDKTVAELRDRIRRLLRAQIDASDPDKRLAGWTAEETDRLHQLWLHADDLSVHTLHAFCQTAVRRDPVANNSLIRTPLTEDAPLADIAIDRLLRGPWVKDPERLQKIIRALDIVAGDAWRKKLTRLVLKWQPWRFDTLDPDSDPGTVPVLEAEAKIATTELQEAIATVNNGGFPVEAFRRSFEYTKTGRPATKADETRRKHAYEKVFRFVEQGAVTSTAVLYFFRSFSKGSKAIKNGWATEIPDASASFTEWKQLASVCTQLRALAENLEEARKQERWGLLAEATRELRTELDAEKLRRGLISYEDMPRHLVEALRRNPELAMRLRRRYKACIVDEFQDTDPLQWEILEALCLNGEAANDAHTGMPALPLFLVGDPKQAIYSFRGGDLRTYLTARARIRELATQGNAQGVGLDANFRSGASLIEVLNAVFANEEWFGPAPEIPPDPAWRLPGVSDDIVFTPVHAGRTESAANRGPVVLLRDFSNAPLDAAGKPLWPRKTDTERAVRDWIAARIATALQKGINAEGVRVKAGDFAVLTRSNPEGEAVARRLRAHGVPCRIRRRGGPWSGPAADALRLLLEWIEDAVNPDALARILVLPFVPRSAETPESRRSGRPDRCPPLIMRWTNLAAAGRWPEFFTSVLEEGGYRERLASRSEEEGIRFERLTTLLSEIGAAPGTTTRSLCERFDAMRRGEEVVAGDEGEAEGTEGTVTVMTLHLSKGLEFRHVFIAATGAGKKDDFLVLRDTGAQGFRIALDKDDSLLRQQADAESYAEDKRLYYVGFTRARESLHIPLLPERFSHGPSGPLGGFVAAALRNVSGNATLNRFVQYDVEELEEGRLTQPVDSSMMPLQAVHPDRDSLVRDSRMAFERRRRVTSYSSLARRAGDVLEIETLLDETGSRTQRQETETETPNDILESIAVISAEDLPPGAAAGTALHAILEHTRFNSVLQADSPEAWLAQGGNLERIEEALRRESIDPGRALAAARAVWNTLRMPLPDPAGGPDFRLSDLEDKNDYHHEVEFLLKLSANLLPEGVVRQGDFLWGFMDLVFRRDGRYYLLDWKSNILPTYDETSVARSMKAHRYDLQWKLYSIALDRWLKARLSGYDPSVHFGGVHYLYLRGSSPLRFSGFSERPTIHQLREEFPAEISHLVAAGMRGTP